MDGVNSYKKCYPQDEIVSEEQYEMTVDTMNQPINKGELTPDKQDYLTMLGTLVMTYENERCPDEEFEL